jgi:(1->4)-alpha-D-glucan 1-alpha-D-glucosylmutase
VSRELQGGTYRLQLRPGFGFDEGAGLADYLSDLGITTVYLSPVAEAVPASVHGYDGTDPTALRQELGGREGFERLVEALHGAGLGILLDIVPNHLSTWPKGPWWGSVLALGRDSPYGDVFDISWEEAGGKVVLPVLGAPLQDVLDGTTKPGLELRSTDCGRGLVLGYGDLELPLREGSAVADDDVAEVLGRQHYRLSCWRERGGRNYRRFFDIDGLVGVRVEDPAVFGRTHALYAELLGSGAVDGLRVDHVDGLADPGSYLARLAELAGDAPIIVEKILGPDELLPAAWPVSGTTGYEAMDDIAHAVVDASGLSRLVSAARGEGDGEVSDVVAASKRLVAESLFSAELGHAAELLELSQDELVAAAVELPVYRTYGSRAGMPEESREVLASLRSLSPESLARLEDTEGHLGGVVRFQQASGPIAAKGVEDTAWYRLVGRLPFLEVGGDPEEREEGAARLCARATARAGRHPGGLNPGTTHDTKRSEDARARLLALCELPEALERGLGRLAAALAGPLSPLERRYLAMTVLSVAPLDDTGWDELPDRLDEVVRKAAREAKLHTSWTDPVPKYEESLVGAARRLVADRGALLRDSFGELVDTVAALGATLSLASLVLRAVLPGVPDTYQGDEVWNYSLVDPDNRRAVGYEHLRGSISWLDEHIGGVPTVEALDQLRSNWRTGALKLHVVRALLAGRREAPHAFSRFSSLVPLSAEGPAASSLLGVGRVPAELEALPGPGSGPDGSPVPAGFAIAAVTRLPSRLACAPGDLPAGEPAWGDTRLVLPPSLRSVVGGAGRRGVVNVLTGERLELAADTEVLPAAAVFAHLPVALLLPEPI